MTAYIEIVVTDDGCCGYSCDLCCDTDERRICSLGWSLPYGLCEMVPSDECPRGGIYRLVKERAPAVRGGEEPR